VKFLDLVWAALLGFAVFGTVPAVWTVAGGVVILVSTLWLARRESRGT
jgi:drug/metabolite transporter (DMT)-like permease